MSSTRVGLYVGRLVLALLPCALACGDGTGEHEGQEGEHDADSAVDEGAEGSPSGSLCPPGNTLTYESFGEDFMSSYCVRCHSSEIDGKARNGAPLDHDFDSLIGILSVAEHIDELAAAGPDAVNTVMPPNGDAPSEDEREKLGQWLACEIEDVGGDGGTH